MRAPSGRACVFVLGLLCVQAPSAWADHDSISREIFLRLSTEEPNAVSRETFFRRSFHEVDAISRQVVFHRSLGQDTIVSRETSLGFVRSVEVIDGFLIREYASVPTGAAAWMSLAVKPGLSNDQLDLFVASTTQQFGVEQGPPDDFIHRVGRSTLDVGEFVALGATDSDPADIAFHHDGSVLYVAARHHDGFAPGDTGGAILGVDTQGFASGFFTDGSVAHGPIGLALAPPASAFDPGLYVGNDLVVSPSIFALSTTGVLQPFASNSPSSLGGIAFARGNSFGDLLYIGCDDGVIRRVDSAGLVSAFSAPLGVAVQRLAFSSQHGFGEWLYALLADGRIVRLDAAGNATPFLEGLLIEMIGSDVVRNDLEFTPAGDILYVSDARRGKVYGIQTSPPTDAGEPDSLPRRSLASLTNFPNPFNPATTLRFELGAAQTVDLDVYDVRGRHVRGLLSRQSLPPGEQLVRWDGRDENGRPMASGVYFALLKLERSAQRQKMIVLK